MSLGAVLRAAAAFVAGFAAALAVGAGAGLFERGPTAADVDAARAAGREEGASAVAVRLAGERERRLERAYEGGIALAEWLLLPGLDELPNPRDWFRGVDEGRSAVAASAAEAREFGYRLGYRHGAAVGAPGPLEPPTGLRIDEVLVVSLDSAEVRLRWDPVPGATGYRVRQDGAAFAGEVSWRRTHYRISVLLPSLETVVEVQSLRGAEASEWARFRFGN